MDLTGAGDEVGAHRVQLVLEPFHAGVAEVRGRSRRAPGGPSPATRRQPPVAERPASHALGVADVLELLAPDARGVQGRDDRPHAAPATRSTCRPASASSSSTPTWAKARAPPPASTSPSARPASRSASPRRSRTGSPAARVSCQASVAATHAARWSGAGAGPTSTTSGPRSGAGVTASVGTGASACADQDDGVRLPEAELPPRPLCLGRRWRPPRAAPGRRPLLPGQDRRGRRRRA